jgi:hypothetical protein
MRVPLKLSAIDREHLQELYDAAGVPRDQLPYSPQFDEIWQGFQDRTFKNAEREQVYGALLKYVRSGSHPAPAEVPQVNLSDEQLKQLKALLPRHSRAGKILPYSDEFEAVRSEFNKLAGTQLSDGEFWHAILRSQGPKRRPPKRTKAVAAETEADDESSDAGDDE